MDVLDRMGSHGHPEEDHLERYIMKTCSETEADAIEEHLLICEQCQTRLHCAEEWVSLMKTALPLSPSRRRVSRWRERLLAPVWGQPGNWWNSPAAMAGACAALLVLLISVPTLQRELAPDEELVALVATRGLEPAVVAGSHHLLHLKLDATDLAEPLEVQLVDAAGTSITSEAIDMQSPELKLNRTLQPGLYWVRLNSPAGDHATLREFRLLVK